MFIPLPIISMVVSAIVAIVSLFLIFLFCENPKRNISVWFIICLIGIILFICSLLWGIVELFMGVV